MADQPFTQESLRHAIVGRNREHLRLMVCVSSKPKVLSGKLPLLLAAALAACLSCTGANHRYPAVDPVCAPRDLPLRAKSYLVEKDAIHVCDELGAVCFSLGPKGQIQRASVPVGAPVSGPSATTLSPLRAPLPAPQHMPLWASTDTGMQITERNDPASPMEHHIELSRAAGGVETRAIVRGRIGPFLGVWTEPSGRWIGLVWSIAADVGLRVEGLHALPTSALVLADLSKHAFLGPPPPDGSAGPFPDGAAIVTDSEGLAKLVVASDGQWVRVGGTILDSVTFEPVAFAEGDFPEGAGAEDAVVSTDLSVVVRASPEGGLCAGVLRRRPIPLGEGLLSSTGAEPDRPPPRCLPACQ